MPDPTHPLVTATSLAVGTTGTHTLNAATTNDYYRFTLSGRSSVNLALTGLDSNVDLQLLGSSGVVLQQSTNTGTTADDVNFTDLSAGVYYIRVLPANGTTSAHYTLSLQAQQNAQTDLLWRNYSTGQNALWQMQGTTLASSVSLTAVADSHWQLAGSADFTGDGQADLVWRNQATGQNAVWQMNGTTLVSSLPLPAVTDLNWQIVSVADWNGDGQADLLWRNQATGANQVWLMQGLATVTTLSLPAVTDRNWQLAGSGDWNRDGQADLVWRNQATGQNAVWLMQGTTYVTNAFLTPLNDSNWRIAGVSDWNGDNQPDLVWRNQSTGQDAIWYLQGTTLGGGVFFTQVADLNWQIAAPWVVYGDPGVADTAGNTTTTAFNIGSLTGQATYTGVVNSSDTNDYYRFTLPTAAPTVTLQLNGLSGDADLQLLDASGNTLQTASNSGTTAERLQRSLTAGTYYLRVYPGVTGASANYTLSFDANPTTLADSFTLQEGNNFLTQISKSIALGPTQGTRKLSFDVSAQWGTANAAGALEDNFLVYLVDATNHTLLDQGQGTAVFSLAGSKAEFTPGLVTYNGTTVTLDLSSLKDQTSGTLIFQLLNNDTDTTAAVQVQHLTSTVDPTGVSSPTLAAATTVLPGAAISNVSSFTTTTALKPLLSNLHRNPTTGKFVANLQVQNTGTTAVGRQLIALFANLPAGVTLVNASGTNANGKPYLNLKPAIANGGLQAGALSDAVEITFDDPNLVSFNWQPTFLSGPANQAPVLNAIAPITLTPGAYRIIALGATDPDGDRITYSLQSTGPIPPATISGDGTLVLTPSPAQIRDYQFTIIASDGVLETQQAVTLHIVTDPVTTTRLSGVIQNTAQQAFVNVKVELGGIQTQTDSTGAFQLQFTGAIPDGLLKVDGKQLTVPNTTYPDVTADVTQLLGHTAYTGYSNVIQRPITLQALNGGQTPTTANPKVTLTGAYGNTTLNAPPGAIKDPQGNNYTGSISITAVKPEQVPVKLPDGIGTDGIIAIDMGNGTCPAPQPLSMPTPYVGVMDLYRLSPQTGTWEKVGSGYGNGQTVSPDNLDGSGHGGYGSGGVGGGGYYFYTPQPFPAKALSAIDLNPNDVCVACRAKKQFNSDASVELHSGAVTESHDLLAYQAEGATQSLSLRYDSLRADPRPIIHFGYENVPYKPDYYMVAKLTLHRGDFTYQVPGYTGSAYGLTGGENFWSIPPSGGSIDGALQVDLRNQPSGIYYYDLTTGIKVKCDCNYFIGQSTTQRDRLVIVNEKDSPFGDGWGLSGWEKIIENPPAPKSSDPFGPALLIDGDGTQLVFDFAGVTATGDVLYTSPEGDFSTLVKRSDGTFIRTMKDQTVYTFNAQNQIATAVDRNHQETDYTYNTAGQLVQMVDPAGLATTFAYNTAGKVTTITNPASTTATHLQTVLGYDGAGNLTSITDPDGKPRTWSYDTGHHLVGETDKLHQSEQSFYDFAGRAKYSIDKDGSVVKVTPAQVRGLYAPDATTNPDQAPTATLLTDVHSDYTDGNGNLFRTVLDKAEEAVTTQDGEGASSLEQRDQNNLVTQSTDARGHTTSYTYDNKGNLIQTKDDLSSGIQATNSLFPHPVSEQYGKTIAQDWNHDGNLDLLTATGGTLTVAYGDGRGDFSSPVSTPIAANGVLQAVADFNGDGRLDLLTASYDKTTLTVALQQSDGTFNATNLAANATAGSDLIAVGLADLDGDGDLDLFSVNGTGYGHETELNRNNIKTWLNNGQGVFTLDGTTHLDVTPDAATFADVSGDGRADCIVTSDNAVSVWLRGSDGSFTQSGAAITGGGKVQSAVGDVTGDGKLDLAIVNADGKGISLLTGGGDGSFAAPAALLTLPSGTTNQFTSVVFSDINGDGKLDLLGTVNTSEQNVKLLLGQGNGAFAPTQVYTLTAQVYTLTGANSPLIGDFNTQAEDPSKSSKLDLLNPASYGTPALLVNQGDGTFALRPDATTHDYSVGTNPVAIATGDLNGDSIPDVVTANAGANTVSVRLGNGDGTFTTVPDVTVGTNPQAIALGDLNGDGYLDFVTANYNDGTLSIGLGNGKGVFTVTSPVSLGAGMHPTGIALGDFNRDGKLDLAITNGNQVSVLLQNANGTLAFDTRQDVTVGSTAKAVVVGDVNGDGYLDLVTDNFGSNDVSVVLGTASGIFGQAQTFAVGAQPMSVALGDVNNDGKLDLVSVSGGSAGVPVLLGTGGTTLFGTKTNYQVGYAPTAVALGDVNNDGKLDVLVTNQGSVSLLLGDGTGVFPAPNRFDFTGASYPQALALADLNLDGALDFVTANVSYQSGSTIAPRLNDLLQVSTAAGSGKHTYDYDKKYNPLTGQFDLFYTKSFNQLTHEVDELGHQTIYELDENTGNVIRMVRVVGAIDSATNWDNRTGDDVITTYTYTPDGRVQTLTDPLGRVTRYDYSTNSTTVSINGQSVQLLNPTGQLRSITVAEGTTDQATQWFGYDAAGNQTVMVDENGHLTEYHYDLKTNRLLEVVAADPDGAGPLTTPKTVYTYDDNGNQITVTDPDGHVTTSHYDALNRLDKVTGADPDGTSGPLLAPITTYIYDHNGNLTMTTDPLGHTTQSSYDARNRLSGMTNPDGSTTQTLYDFDNNATGSINARSQRTNTIYDARGRRLRETDALGNTTRYVYDPANQLIATIDAKGNLTRYVYDDLGRQLEVIDAQGHHTKTEYDKNGNVTATIDALGHRTEYRYDARDRRIQVIDATNTVLPLTQQKATVTTYDKVGNVLTITDPDRNTTTYTYDGLNRLVADTNQLGQRRTYGYDAASNQTSVTDRNGHTRTLTYDGLNRQTQENWLNGSGSGIRAITSIYNVGSQLTELQDPDSDYHYTYDLNGRVQTITNAGTPDVVPVVLTYAYDGNGNLTSVVDTINGQAGGTTSYTFDPLDQVSQINQTGVGVQSKQVNLGYNALGQMATINRYADLNGTQLVAGTTYTYDALNRLQQLSHQKAGGSNIASYTYGYDAASRIQQIISSADGTTTYNYDNTNQLTGADKPGTTADEGYTYDANGNRANTGYQTGTGNNNQLSSDGTYNYTYDNEGNLKTRTEIATGKVRAFTWDYRNRLTGVTDKTSGTVTQQVSYTYDALNQRLAKTVGTQTTRFVYDRGNVYLEFSGTSTTPSTRYLYGPMVDQVLAQESQGNTTWMLTDHLGSVRDLVNNSGTVVNHFTYDSFGQVVGSTANATADTRYKFTGREFDQETGLYYYRARYFDAGVGRFIGQDPMGFGAGDRNLYRYVGNSPLNATDPSGLQAVFGIDPPIINPFPPVPGSLLLPPKITPEQERTLENYKRADRRRLKSEPNECISAPINGRLPTSTPTNATLKNANGYADYVTGQTDDFLVIRPDGLGKAFDGVNTGNRTLLEAKYGYWRVPLSNEALKNDPRSIETRDKQRASVLRSLSVEEQVAAYCGYNLNAYFQNPNAYNWFKANYSSPDLIVSPFGGFKYQFNMVNKPWQPPRSK